MLIAITGTPGTGKTSVCKACRLDCINLNSVIEAHGFYIGRDHTRGCLIADINKLRDYVHHQQQQHKPLVIESHLAHLLKPDVAIVLRASPEALTGRLRRKGFPPQKIEENVEAETLDVILIEAVDLCPVVYELDTTGRTVTETAITIRDIIDAELSADDKRRAALRRRFHPGSVNWL